MLRSTKIYLRPFTADDAIPFYEAASESVATVGAWLPWCHPKFSLSDASAWMRECMNNHDAGLAYDMGIFGLEGGRFLGGIAINQINTRYKFGNIGYWVRQSEQGKGIATEAVRLIIQFGFEQLNLTRLEIAVIEANEKSRRVAANVEAKFEGIARNRLVKDGKPIAAAMYSVIPE